jgi:hypothetical protein
MVNFFEIGVFNAEKFNFEVGNVTGRERGFQGALIILGYDYFCHFNR